MVAAALVAAATILAGAGRRRCPGTGEDLRRRPRENGRCRTHPDPRQPEAGRALSPPDDRHPQPPRCSWHLPARSLASRRNRRTASTAVLAALRAAVGLHRRGTVARGRHPAGASGRRRARCLPRRARRPSRTRRGRTAGVLGRAGRTRERSHEGCHDRGVACGRIDRNGVRVLNVACTGTGLRRSG